MASELNDGCEASRFSTYHEHPATEISAFHPVLEKIDGGENDKLKQQQQQQEDG